MLKSVIIRGKEISSKCITLIKIEGGAVQVEWDQTNPYEEGTLKVPFREVQFVDDTETPLGTLREAVRQAMSEVEAETTRCDLHIDGKAFGGLVAKTNKSGQMGN